MNVTSKEKNVKTLTGFSVLLALAMAGISFGQSKPASEPASQPTTQQFLDKMTKACSLSEEQVKKVKEIQEAREKALDEIRAAFRANSAALQDAAKNDDVGKTMKAQEEQPRLVQRMQEIEKKYDDASLALLSDEQKAKWTDIKDAERTEMGTQVYTKLYEDKAKLCGLSDDQVKSMVAIQMANDKAYHQWEKDNPDAVKAYHEMIGQAMIDHDQAKFDQANKLLEPLRAIQEKCEEDTLAVMKDDQRAKWILATVAERYIQYAAESFKLTRDQMSQAIDLLKPLAAEKGATIDSAGHKLMDKVFSEIATKEQKMKWLEKRTLEQVGLDFAQANLTADQWYGIKQDYARLVEDEKTAPDIASAKDMAGAYKLVTEIAKKLSPQVQAKLTDEQKKAMEKATATKPAK